MTEQEALDVFNTLIELSLKAGIFSTRSDIKQIDEAYDTLQIYIVRKSAEEIMEINKNKE